MTDTNKTQNTSLYAISPIDGRYQQQTVELQEIFSEAGLITRRLEIEMSWFETLMGELKDSIKIDQEHKKLFLKTFEEIRNKLQDRKKMEHEILPAIKELEQTTNHDVKSIEYFLTKQPQPTVLGVSNKLTINNCSEKELLHFACTSDDINNLAYALIIKEAREKILLQYLDNLIEILRSLAHEHANVPMLARTHGQPATPTTVGKEFANFVKRLEKQRNNLAKIEIMAKFNGATGNFSAHSIAFPNIDWQTVCQKFVENFNLTWNLYTTQIEPHDYIVEVSNVLAHINNILIGFCRDMWGYISLNYFTQITKPDHQSETTFSIGSSVMPHKINPIDFENAEGNLGLANALLQHFANKLPISRWQRDLSDSTVMRNIGSSFAYCLIAYKSIVKGLGKIAVNKEFLQSELDQHWEVLAEAIQTTMRGHMVPNAYEQLRELTRGKKIDQKILADFIDKLNIPDEAKKRLKNLTPSSYTGLAAKLAKEV